MLSINIKQHHQPHSTRRLTTKRVSATDDLMLKPLAQAGKGWYRSRIRYGDIKEDYTAASQHCRPRSLNTLVAPHTSFYLGGVSVRGIYQDHRRATTSPPPTTKQSSSASCSSWWRGTTDI